MITTKNFTPTETPTTAYVPGTCWVSLRYLFEKEGVEYNSVRRNKADKEELERWRNKFKTEAGIDYPRPFMRGITVNFNEDDILKLCIELYNDPDARYELNQNSMHDGDISW